MLGLDDFPTIRHAIIKRLSLEPGVRVAEVQCKKHKDKTAPDDLVISVGVLLLIDNTLVSRSRFDLPAQFAHAHLLNEIDEISEQVKSIRKDFQNRNLKLTGDGIPESLKDKQVHISGTGVRGRWPTDLKKKEIQA